MKRRTEMASQDDPCDICGDIGYVELIVTCSSCPARQHIYCAAQFGLEVPEDWYCEFCQSTDHEHLTMSHLREESNAMFPSLRQAYPKRQRTAKPSKVMCLSTEEVIKLERKRTYWSCMCRRSNVAKSSARRNTLKSKVFASKVPVRAGSQHPLERRGLNIGSSVNQQRLKGKKDLVQQPEEQLMDIDKSGGDNGAVAASGYSSEETRFLHYVLPKLKVCRPYLPALSATWSGRLKFPGDAIADDSSYLFRAHPLCSVHRKAYELSLHMPMEIRMEPIPLTHILTDIFPNEGPDMGDIGLYFFPANTVDRYISKYSALVQLMVSQEYAMRGIVNGAELLLFTSKELHVDSHLFIVGLQSEYFLWGIFRSARSTLGCESLHEELNVQPPLFVVDHSNNGHANSNESNVIDSITGMIDLSRNREEETIDEIALPGTDFGESFQEHAQDVVVDPVAANYTCLPLVESTCCPAFNNKREDTFPERVGSSSGVEAPKQSTQQVKVEVQEITQYTQDVVERSGTTA